MSAFRDLTYLEHILDSIGKINLYTRGISKEDFQAATMVQDAVIRQFEIIGEAAKRVSEELKQENPGVPWKDMAGMRDVLIHDYIDVEIDVVWKTVQDYLPALERQIKAIVKSLQ